HCLKTFHCSPFTIYRFLPGVPMKRTSPLLLLLSIFAVLVFIIFGTVRSTASGPNGSRPLTAANQAIPTTVAGLRSVAAQQEPAPAIDQRAWQQIQALLEEKEARTPAQQKIDSQLLYAIKMR